ncbi:MAG: hypothetical protein R3F59_32290 [Myxococcota bacterium]
MSPFSLLLAALTPDAHAVWYAGNPVLNFRVDRPSADYVEGTATLTKVRVNHCAGGSTDYTVGSIDPVATNQLSIAAGNECSLTFFWGSNVDIDGDGSLGTFTVRYAQSSTTVTLASTIDPVALSPYSVISGSMSGGSPWLLVDIE